VGSGLVATCWRASRWHPLAPPPTSWHQEGSCRCCCCLCLCLSRPLQLLWLIHGRLRRICERAIGQHRVHMCGQMPTSTDAPDASCNWCVLVRFWCSALCRPPGAGAGEGAGSCGCGMRRGKYYFPPNERAWGSATCACMRASAHDDACAGAQGEQNVRWFPEVGARGAFQRAHTPAPHRSQSHSCGRSECPCVVCVRVCACLRGSFQRHVLQREVQLRACLHPWPRTHARMHACVHAWRCMQRACREGTRPALGRPHLWWGDA